MEFICNRSDLQKSINIVEKAISQRMPLDILENISIELMDGKLKLRGHDCEICIENIINVNDAHQAGSVLVKAKTISSIISKLQDQEVIIKVEDQSKMVITSGKVGFDILCMSNEEYPDFPGIENIGNENLIEFKMTAGDLKDVIKHTIFAVSFDEYKQFLNGILVKNERHNLCFVATDGYRLSLKKKPFKEIENEFSVIVPYKAMNELYKIIQQIDSEQDILFNILEEQILFKIGDTLLVSKVIKGPFPDYEQVLPKKSDNIYSVPRKFLQSAAERASIIAAASNNLIRMAFDCEKVVISANAASLGDFKEELAVSRLYGEADTRLAFNVKLILDAIKNLEADDLKLEFNSGLSPCVLKQVGDDDYTYILMPIRTNDYQTREES